MSIISSQVDELRSYASSRKGEIADICTRAADTIEMLSEKLRSAQPERKTGKWLKCPNRGWGEIWVCNHCGETTVSSIMGEPRYRFCPMCGYEMLNGGEPDEID